jgi:hypothetical protein
MVVRPVLPLMLLLAACPSDSPIADDPPGDDETTATPTTAAPTTTASASDSGGSSGSGDPSGSTGDPVEPPPAVDWPTLECDVLVPTYCGLPFPSNVFTAADPSTPTGRRLALSDAVIPDGSNNEANPPDLWNRADGFSPGLALMAHLPGATIDGLATPVTIERSLADDSPTIVLDVATGERVPHWAELDMSHDQDDRRAFIVRPAVRLKDDARYIVAIRGVVDQGGAALAPAPAFAALRDVTAFDDPSIDARRPLYADIFARLADAGVARDDLQLAWDFTTASRANNTAGMLKMRDEALAIVGEDGPEYVVDKLQLDVNESIAYYIEGRMTVPLYLDDPGPGGLLVLGADGLPELQGEAEYEFTLVIPPTAQIAPVTPLQYGHGLLGSGRDEIQYDYRVAFAENYKYALFAVDWIGMSEEDELPIAAFIDGGRLTEFQSVVDRGQQGILNALLAMRMVRGGLADDSMLQFMGEPLIDGSAGYYHGNSQGGIFGASYMALTTDVTRGMLGVPGQPYNLLLNRSVDFDMFWELMQGAFPDPIDDQMVLALFQIQWDRAEPTGYSAYIREDTLPNTPSHEVLLPVAIGDHQVTTLGAHLMARSIGGVVNLGPTNRTIFGLEEKTGPHDGSAMIEYSFDLAPEPTTNIPPTDGMDPHGKVRKLPSAEQSLDQFLRTGTIESFCAGPCDPE